ncbi:hypothetical protein H4R20_002192 [Coemansia guatemalensis]|uniref:Rab3 GTPase-activating protein catalytic subunit n=1 Tax=Coemansia guatemalensis TaxID=2761395 RepID=A0A9W8LUX4_9FUNG|nr:hypothetical protein H4R20_002192 [Coemansia guatemalensis]
MADTTADDDDNFELVDYTAASAWEKFIAAIETRLRKWNVSNGGTGDFNLPELRAECAELVVRNKRARRDVLTRVSRLCTRTAHISYRGTIYALTLSVHPLLDSSGDGENAAATAAAAAGKLAAFDRQFPPVHAPELEIDHSQSEPDPAWHPLHRWTGNSIILYLQYQNDDGYSDDDTPDLPGSFGASSGDNYSVSLETAKLLMSSINIALQNARCQLPAFVPVGDAWRLLYTGKAIGHGARQHASGHVPAIVRKFESVCLPQAPTAYLQLSGLLELFVSAFRVRGHAPRPEAPPSGATAPNALSIRHEWDFVANAVYLAALHVYRIKNTYSRDWNATTPDFSYRMGDLNVGPVNDPLRVIHLSALFQRSPCRTYVDPQTPGRDRLYLKTSSAWLLTAQMLPADRERTMLTEALEDAFAAWEQSASDASRHRHLNMAEQMEAHAEITGDMLIDLFGSTAKSHVSLPGSGSAAEDDEAVHAAEAQLARALAEVYADTNESHHPLSASQLITRMPHGTAVPHGSLLWRLSEIILVATAKRSADFWGAPSMMTFLRLLWAMALTEIRWRWENARLLPRIPAKADDVTQQDGALDNAEATSVETSDVSQQHARFDVHLRYTLAYQKLEMLNCCVERKLCRSSSDGGPETAGHATSAGSNKTLRSRSEGAGSSSLVQRIRARVRDHARRQKAQDHEDQTSKPWARGSRIRRPIGRLLTSMRSQPEEPAADIDEFEEIKAETYASDSDGFVSAEDIDYEDGAVLPDVSSKCDAADALLVDQDSLSDPELPLSPMRLPTNAIQHANMQGSSMSEPPMLSAEARDSNYVDVAISSSLDSTSGFHHVSDVYERDPILSSSSADKTPTSLFDSHPATADSNAHATCTTSADMSINPMSADELNEDERAGGLYPSESLRLLETDQPTWIPKIQMHPVLTEDMLREREAILMSFGTSTEGAQQRARLQCAELISDMQSFKAANPGCILADFVRWHSPRDWIVPEGRSDREGYLSARMTARSASDSEDSNLWQQLWSEARRVPADQQKPLFDYEMEAEKALHYLEGIPVYSLFASLLPTMFLITYERLYRQPIVHRIGCLRQRLASLGTRIVQNVDWAAADPDDSAYGSVMDDLEELEVQTSRCVSLLCKFPGQYSLVETLVQQGRAIVDDRNMQKVVLKALSKYNILSATPARQEYVFSADLHDANVDGLDVPQRMHVVIDDTKSIRVVYCRTKAQGTISDISLI